MSIFSRSLSHKQRALTVSSPRLFDKSISSPRFSRKSEVSRLFCVLIAMGSVVSFFLAIGGGYLYVLPSLTKAFHEENLFSFNGSDSFCDIFDGKWVVDNSYPLYNASECPFVEKGFNCLDNGRTNDDYLKWRWKPRNCELPRLDVHNMLEMLRNKRIVFVGDSMSRTQWESLICMLMTGVQDKGSVYEVNGNKITKVIRFLGVRFSSFNFTIEFYRSVFLVQHTWSSKYGIKRVRSTLTLDKLDDISNEWINADVLIFNSGQWWVPGKLFGVGCYFQLNNTLRLGMSIQTAFRTALDTWSSWIDTKINPNKTHVFFRTFEPSHWSNLTLRLCNVTNQPLSETNGLESSSFSDAVVEVAHSMKVPVNVLHITPMSAFRKDAHVGLWSDNPSLSDCSHWCLPGVPDLWNEMVFFYLHDSYRHTLLYPQRYNGRSQYSNASIAEDVGSWKGSMEGVVNFVTELQQLVDAKMAQAMIWRRMFEWKEIGFVELTEACIRMMNLKKRQDYVDLFEVPTDLSLSREHDHRIVLKEGVSPINVRPYKHHAIQKNEIEKLVQEILDSGVIRHSASPYSSPIVIFQLKKKLGNHVPTFTLLVVHSDNGHVLLMPQDILDRRMIKKNGRAVTQLLVKWFNLAEEDSTWDNYHSFTQQFLDFNP